MSRHKTPTAGESRTLVVAPAASLRIEAARRWLAVLPPDAEAMVMAPHGHAADELVRSVVATSGARFGIRRATPDRFAARLAAPELARLGIAPGTALSLAAVVTRAVHVLYQPESGGRFASVARRPGFPHAVAHTFEDLRAAGVPTAALAKTSGWGRDLATLVEQIEEALTEMRLADRAAVFALATSMTERGAAGDGPLLLLDLPLERGIERTLVAALAARAPRVLATAPAGDTRAIAALEAMLGVTAERFENGNGEGSLSKLQRHLFEETAPDVAPVDDSVLLASWPGEARECVEIARRLQSEAERGTRFDRMAVLLRAPGLYRAHVTEALRRAGIPAHFASGTTRPDSAGRALLALLACAAEGVSARRFAEYLSLAQVPDPGDSDVDPWSPPDHDLITAPAEVLDAGRLAKPEPLAPLSPDSPTIDGTLRAPWRWERLLVDAAVIGGAERWQRRLDGLAAEIALRRSELPEDDARATALDRTVADLDHLRGFALPVIRRLTSLPLQATWGEWLVALRALAAAAIRHPDGVLAVLVELEPLSPVGPVDLAMVQHVLAPRLRELRIPPETRPEGAVFVAPVEMARGLEFDVVIVPGLAEKLFPQRILQDPLLPDEARAPLGSETLPTQESRVAMERLGLRLAAGAATRKLVLSWPRVDVEQARPRVPSFYGLEALRAAEGHLPGFEELRARAELGGRTRLGWPAPELPEHAVDDTEYDLAVLARLKDQDPRTSRGAAHYLLAANPHLARALRARGRRWLKRWTIADGLVDPDVHALEALARHRMGARSFSPTALENFAACPYRFLLQAIHRLQPREEIGPLETMDPLTRGALFHEVQFRVLTALRERKQLPLDATRLEEAISLLDQAIVAVAAEYKERLAPAIPRVWADGVNAIRVDLREWLRRSVENAGDWVPHRFELSFGLSKDARPTADDASVTEPVAVEGGALLRGSIDLVERRADGTLRVTDHKTGKARVPEGAIVWGGAAMQPVLYALATEALLQAPVDSGRLYYCTADGDWNERNIPLDDVSRMHARTALAVVGRAIEQGFLPAAPAPDACRWCAYRPVCGPYEESRTSRKPADRLVDLKTLRSLP